MIRIALLFVFAVVAGAAPACAQDWSWLQPGKTTKTEVVDKAGAPARSFNAKAVRGMIDWNLPAPDGPKGLRDLALEARPTLDVEVLVYRAGAPPADEPDRLVFLHERLLYAVFLTPEKERALPADPQARAKWREVFFETPAAGGFRKYWVSIPESGDVGYVQLERTHWNVPGAAMLRAIWAEPKAFDPELNGVEWTWPTEGPAYDWSWVRPGVTTRAQVIERAGPPRRIQAGRRVVKGLVDPDFGEHKDANGLPVLLDPQDPRLVAVDVGEYDHGDALAFLGDRVLYLRVQSPCDERGAAALEAKYGNEQTTLHADHPSGCLYEQEFIVSYARARLAFVAAQTPQGPGEFTVRLAWAEAKDFAAELGGAEWRLPEGKGWWLPPAKK